MGALIAGLALFLGVHSVRIVADGWRTRQVARLGLNGWKGLYSLAALAGFGLIVWGYGATRAAPIALFDPPAWTRSVASLLSLVAFILITAAYVPGTRIKAAIGHPMLAGTTLWAFGHLIANGTLADLLLFGGFLFWAIFDLAASRRRDRAAGTTYAKGPIARDAIAIVVGVVAWWIFAAYLHGWLIGVRPFG